MSEPDPPNSFDTLQRRISREELARHSVFNEPNIFPGRPPEVIETDWRCSTCGYNLRGLVTGTACPECGMIEIYRPPPPGAISYASWYRENRDRSTRLRRLLVLAVAIAAGGPFAIVGTFLTMMPSALGPVLMGPIVEEMMKIGVILLIIETRPFWLRSENDTRIAAVASAVGFAVIENLLYLGVYISGPSLGLVLWRWIVCTGLHLTCTLIAAEGAVAVWRHTDEQQREPMLKHMYRPMTAAIVIHAAYNAIVTFAHLAGLAF